MRFRFPIFFVMVLVGGGLLFANGTQQAPAGTSTEPMVIQIRTDQPEYLAKERQVWDVFEQENPDLKVDLITVNESEEAAFNARVAAGNPPVFSAHAYAQTMSDADQLLDLQTVDFKWWDNFTYDAKHAWASKFGVNKVPILVWSTGPLASFIYYSDEMGKAGLDPSSIRTIADLDAFLANLKTYVDTRSDLKYVIATGWHEWCWPYEFLNEFITMFDPDAQAKVADLYTGKTKWTDLANNPYVPAFAKLKEWYDKGYFPSEFWKLSWEEDFENAFIARKAILTFHGPWLWDKIQAADPTAQLSGFPLPANSAGKIQAFPPDVTQGPGIYKSIADDPKKLDAAVRALNFYLSPEGVKMLAESIGVVPAYDLSSVGGLNLQSQQYLSVIKPVQEGAFGNAVWDMTSFGADAGNRFYVEGRPDPKYSENLQPMWGDFFSGKTDMAGLMAAYQTMFDQAYKVQ